MSKSKAIENNGIGDTNRQMILSLFMKHWMSEAQVFTT